MGICNVITSDQGTDFNNSLNRQRMDMLGIHFNKYKSTTKVIGTAEYEYFNMYDVNLQQPQRLSSGPSSESSFSEHEQDLATFLKCQEEKKSICPSVLKFLKLYFIVLRIHYL